MELATCFTFLVNNEKSSLFKCIFTPILVNIFCSYPMSNVLLKLFVLALSQATTLFYN